MVVGNKREKLQADLGAGVARSYHSGHWDPIHLKEPGAASARALAHSLWDGDLPDGLTRNV